MSRSPRMAQTSGKACGASARVVSVVRAPAAERGEFEHRRLEFAFARERGPGGHCAALGWQTAQITLPDGPTQSLERCAG
jgi:hypothetical protein